MRTRTFTVAGLTTIGLAFGLPATALADAPAAHRTCITESVCILTVEDFTAKAKEKENNCFADFFRSLLEAQRAQPGDPGQAAYGQGAESGNRVNQMRLAC
jgi:hypothetical protein